MNMASVSVVIPCYRCAKTILRAVDSVANQTTRPFELILVDDGSDDQTPELLCYIQKQYGKDWIKVLLMSQNSGVSVARNTGWDLASADYVAFLDADDQWHQEKIAVQHTWMRDNPHVAVSGHTCCIVAPDNSVNISAKLSGRYSPHVISPIKLLIMNPFVTPSFMIKRCLDYRFDPSRRYAEDFYLLQQIGFDGNLIVILDVALVNVFKKLGESGASSNLYKMRLGDIRNYTSLWKSRRISFFLMIIAIVFSIIKFLILFIFNGRVHYFFNSVLTKIIRIR